MKFEELMALINNENKEVIIESPTEFLKITDVEENKDIIIIHTKGYGDK